MNIPKNQTSHARPCGHVRLSGGRGHAGLRQAGEVRLKNENATLHLKPSM
jgi:hypothetical protein